MKVNFATSNPFKVKEANSAGKKFGIKFIQIKVDYPEIRAEEVEKVAEEGAKFVFQKIKKPVIVEDTGLYIKNLEGFPSSYSKFVYQKIGNQGILKLMGDTKKRAAVFISAIGYADKKTRKTFIGKVNGTITKKILGAEGFGYDPIFLPNNHKKSFAQDYELKKKISHRKKAFQKFCQWLSKK